MYVRESEGVLVCLGASVCVCKIEQQLTAASRRLAASVLLRARCLQDRNFACLLFSVLVPCFGFGLYILCFRFPFRLLVIVVVVVVALSVCFCSVWEKCNEIVRCPLAVNVLALVIGDSETGASTH